MNIVHGLTQFEPPPRGTALTIGNFDGVHRGHRRLIEAARRWAAPERLPVVVLTFEPHPLAILAPSRAPQRLTTPAEKAALLAACGADVVIIQKSEPEFLRLAAEDFLRVTFERCRPRVVVEGEDFHFGRGRAGSVETLHAAAARWGFALEVPPTERCEEATGAPAINSSAIRRALAEGRVEDAGRMLGRPYRIVGEVVPGQGRGRPLGFPTANLARVSHLLPQEAVYAAAAQLESGAWHPAAVNFGPQPTFAQAAARVEAHLLDYAGGDLMGQKLGLHLLARLRPQIKFAGVEELVAQIQRDAAQTREAGAARLEELQRGPVIAL